MVQKLRKFCTDWTEIFNKLLQKIIDFPYQFYSSSSIHATIMCYKEAKQETTSIYKQGKMDILSKSIYVFVIALIFGIGIKGTMPQFGIKEGIPKNPSKYPRYLLIYFTLRLP